MHAAQQRVEGVMVVVDLDACLVREGAGDAPDILDYPGASSPRISASRSSKPNEAATHARSMSAPRATSSRATSQHAYPTASPTGCRSSRRGR